MLAKCHVFIFAFLLKIVTETTLFIYPPKAFFLRLSRTGLKRVQQKQTKTPIALLCYTIFFRVCSTILEEEKVQQKERNRMEMRRQVTVSWDSGGSDEAPPKVRHTVHGFVSLCVFYLSVVVLNSLVKDHILSGLVSCGVRDIFSVVYFAALHRILSDHP